MLIAGQWLQCDDGIVRPVIAIEVRGADGTMLPVEFLVDIGADRTVLNADLIGALALPHLAVANQLGGVGGAATTVGIGTEIRLSIQGGGAITFQGTFAAFTDPHALDMNVLGRDIMNLFAVIVDYPGNVVCMIGKGHRYAITKDSGP